MEFASQQSSRFVMLEICYVLELLYWFGVYLVKCKAMQKVIIKDCWRYV